MAKKIIKYLVLALSICICPAYAGPILGLDLDPTTDGIQSTFVVTEGDSVSASLVAFDDGMPPSPVFFDTVSVDFFFGGTGTASFVSAAAGSVVGGAAFGSATAPGVTLSPGDTLTPLIGPTGFSISTFLSGGLPVPAILTSGGDPFTTNAFDVLIDLVFNADSAGVVNISVLDLLFSPAGTPGGQLLFAGAPPSGALFPSLLQNTLEVRSATPPPLTGVVSEPEAFVLMGFGIVGLFLRKRRLSLSKALSIYR